MSYQSPIELIQSQIEERITDIILEAVMSVGVNVDKEELLKALAYDRCQYQKGYTDREQEIVRCKDCKYAHMTYDGEVKYCDRISMPDDEGDYGYALYLPGDWYCADGEKR